MYLAPSKNNNFSFCTYIGVWRSWGRFRAHPVGEEARKKEWQPSQNVSESAKRDAVTATGSAADNCKNNTTKQ